MVTRSFKRYATGGMPRHHNIFFTPTPILFSTYRSRTNNKVQISLKNRCIKVIYDGGIAIKVYNTIFGLYTLSRGVVAHFYMGATGASLSYGSWGGVDVVDTPALVSNKLSGARCCRVHWIYFVRAHSLYTQHPYTVNKNSTRIGQVRVTQPRRLFFLLLFIN